jgi:hypothetical protein
MTSVALKNPKTSKPKQPVTSRHPTNPLEGYEVRDREQVEKLVHKRPVLGAQLVEMRAAAREYFPDMERMQVGLMWDSPKDLIVRVVTHDPNAYKQLERFGIEWEDPRWKELGGRLHLTVASP